ncbi:MAG: hypothetical protein LBS83_01525 [Holosporales bacterium]|jgi:hypothetical protein|nr:hypothetical protein [Holosporales bacterium]
MIQKKQRLLNNLVKCVRLRSFRRLESLFLSLGITNFVKKELHEDSSTEFDIKTQVKIIMKTISKKGILAALSKLIFVT